MRYQTLKRVIEYLAGFFQSACWYDGSQACYEFLALIEQVEKTETQGDK